jgi:hypothetical protein
VDSSREQRWRAGVPYSPARRVSASPKRDSGTPMRSIMERNRLRSLRGSGPRMSCEADGRPTYSWTTLRYVTRCGMADLGPDLASYGLRYFEMSPEQAELYLK